MGRNGRQRHYRVKNMHLILSPVFCVTDQQWWQDKVKAEEAKKKAAEVKATPAKGAPAAGRGAPARGGAARGAPAARGRGAPGPAPARGGKSTFLYQLNLR